MDKQPIISFKNFNFKYDAQAEPTLKDINLDIYPGEKVLILGPSGSGKSTLGNCINGLIPHAFPGKITGELTVNGVVTKNSSLFELSNSIGTVLQDTDHQFVGLTVEEDIAFALENSCVPREQMQEQVQKWAKAVGVEELLEKSPHDLSGGQKQRVSLAGVLVDETPILLFDEPLANLDPASGQDSTKLIAQIQAQTQATVVIIEHRLEDVLIANVDRIIVFSHGQIAADTTPEALLKSNTLAELGIREPLWVTALRYAGVDLDQVENIASIDTLAGAEIATKLAQWQASQPAVVPQVKAQSLIKLEKVSFAYSEDTPTILKNINLEIGKGEMISLVGKNGAGKSTLAKIICGFERTSKGQLSWEGQNMQAWSIKEIADHVGYVMQNPNQMITQVKIYDEVALGLRFRKVPEKEVETRVHQVLRTCGLYAMRNWPVSALSYGQKKRLTIASILVLDPKVIILDEPTAGQDYKHYTELMEFLRQINRLGVTIIMVTHDMHLMLEYTHRAIVMVNGQIVSDTTPVKVLTNPSLVKQAALKETSLFVLAQRMGLANPVVFTEKFIAYDRRVHHE
ncbi:heme ABC transporter ATP-binding protein [Psittacicella melopsittaci]|uniref:Heme ABC transporter ATP-binding protein n=1 Tax=Psittacicella melopsittaci TaxID=2028576 RepID=A0A3A1YBQ5_9GAMM|nr:ABC transporter ATP-binding protein [Psittacicella melopsittaci]RIY33634.1 heme ABC transporter ATP-binding protein [Psittacicella melopsittaci]